MSIMDMIGGGGPPPGAGAPPGLPPGGPPGGGMPDEIDVQEEGPPEEGGGAPLDILREAIGGIQDYIAADHDEEDKAEGTKALAILQRILARNQKQDAMGGEGARQLKRALSG